MATTINDITEVTFNLKQANVTLENLSPCERIQWANSLAEGGMVATTSGGRTSRVLPHLVMDSLGFSIPTIFIDTGHYPTETYRHIAKMYADGVDIRFYGAAMSPGLTEAIHGDVWNRDGSEFDDFLNMVKHRPLNQAFRELRPKIWVRGIMGFQTRERSSQRILEFRNGLYRLHPMLDWNKERLEQYLHEHHLQINPGHYDVTKGSSFKKECKIGHHCGFVDGEGI